MSAYIYLKGFIRRTGPDYPSQNTQRGSLKKMHVVIGTCLERWNFKRSYINVEVKLENNTAEK